MTSNSVWTLKGTGRQLRPAADKSKTTWIGSNKTSAVICSSDRYYKCVVEPRAPSVGEVHTGERLTAAKWSHEVVMGNSQNTETIRIFPGGVVLGVILDHLPNHKIYHFRRNHNSVSWWSGDQLIRTNRIRDPEYDSDHSQNLLLISFSQQQTCQRISLRSIYGFLFANTYACPDN